MKTTALVFIILFMGAAITPADEPPQKTQEINFIDADNDGINDVFRDADGNGINDVDGKPYKHKFPVVDRDEDGINDVFRDADGNGVNDLKPNDKDPESPENVYRYLDFDGDGINDITGVRFRDRTSGLSFIDEDGDGIDDAASDTGLRQQMRLRGRDDVFIDQDGDGINDGRAFSREKRRRNPFKDSENSMGRKQQGKPK